MTELVHTYSGEHFTNFEINFNYHFGGYAKIKPELVEFIRAFKQQHQIQLEPVYTGKMFFGLYDMIKKNFFERGTRIVAIHTGGLQGLSGYPSYF